MAGGRAVNGTDRKLGPGTAMPGNGESRDEVGWTANAFSCYAELGRHGRGRVIRSVVVPLRSGGHR